MDSNDSTERYVSFAAMALSGLVTILTFIVISVVTYLAFAHGITFFAWHPPLMLIGFLLLMTQAVLAFSGDNVLTRQIDRARATRLKLHWILQISAGACILTSFICIYTYKANANSDHYSTTHSYLGFLTLLFCLGAACGGSLAAYAVNLRHFIKPIIIKIVHSTFGLVSYSMAIVTIFLGLNHPWTHERLSPAYINTLIAFVGFIWVCAVSRPVITLCGRVGGLTRSN